MTRTRLLGALLAAFVLFGLCSHAKADNCPLVGIYNDDNVTLGAGAQACGLGGTRTGATFHPMGAVFTTTATAPTTTGTTQQTLATFSLPANALDAAGRVLRCSAVYTFAGNAHTKQVGIAFGSEVLDTTSTAYNSGTGAVILHLLALKTGSNTQVVWGDYEVPAGSGISPAVATYEAAGAETDTSAIAINFNALDGTSAASDTVLDHAMCEFIN